MNAIYCWTTVIDMNLSVVQVGVRIASSSETLDPLMT